MTMPLATFGSCEVLDHRAERAVHQDERQHQRGAEQQIHPAQVRRRPDQAGHRVSGVRRPAAQRRLDRRPGSRAGRADPRTSPSVTPSSCQIPSPATSLPGGIAGKPWTRPPERGLSHPGSEGLRKFDGVGTGSEPVDVAICCPCGYGLWSGRDAGPDTDRHGERLQDGWPAGSARDPARWTLSHCEVPEGRLTTFPYLMFDQISDERGRYEVEAFRHRTGDGPGARPGQCL